MSTGNNFIYRLTAVGNNKTVTIGTVVANLTCGFNVVSPPLAVSALHLVFVGGSLLLLSPKLGFHILA